MGRSLRAGALGAAIVAVALGSGCSSDDEGSSWPYGGSGGSAGSGGGAGGTGGGSAGWSPVDGGADAADDAAAGASGSGGSAGSAGSGGAAGSSGEGGSAGEAGSGTGGTGGQPLPTCDCYYGNGLYCGEGVADEAADRGCSVDLLPAHDGDLLRCTDGDWTVDTTCSEGCIVADPGQPDACKAVVSPEAYYLPWTCGVTYTCTQGNNGSFSHSGNMQYAYDFGMPRQTPVLASRGGVVSHSDNLVGPGDACYDGCSDSACCNTCINSGNRVVVDHGDGTSALYLHLDQATVSKGATVQTGDMLGYSGTSGCSYGAHLHFQVMNTCGIWFCSSLPMTFTENANIDTNVAVASQNCF